MKSFSKFLPSQLMSSRTQWKLNIGFLQIPEETYVCNAATERTGFVQISQQDAQCRAESDQGQQESHGNRK